MGWENKIIGYAYKEIDKDEIMDTDCKYLNPIYETRMCGWISDLQPVKVLVRHAIMQPVYKKIRTKKP